MKWRSNFVASPFARLRRSAAFRVIGGASSNLPSSKEIFFPARRTPGVDLAKFYGPAGDGYEYHHIAEQSAEGDIPASDLNSTGNIVRIPKLLHEEINSEYAKTEYGKRTSIREELTGKSFEERQAKGLEVMRDIGIIE